MIYLLDTDHVSELQGRGAAGQRLAACLRHVPPDDYGTTIITFKEQVRRRLAQVAASPNAVTYAALHITFQFYSSLALWQFSDAAEQQFAAWKQAKMRVGTQDLKIAAIAYTTGATLLTRNLRDFLPIPGLLAEDWTA